MDDILKLYFNETEELIDQILDDIDLLKNEPSVDVINEILRKFHTIKGSSYSVGFKKIGDLAHKIEDFFVKIRDGKEELNDEIISNLISVVEKLRNFVETISSQESPQDTGLEIDFEIGEYDRDTRKPPAASSEISYYPQTSYTLQNPRSSIR
jgi:Chemotaxis protein histidine kinase and related kinases